MRTVFVAALTGACLSLFAVVSSGQGERGKDPRPVPRWPDGHVNLASVPGQKGHWIRTRRELVVDGRTTNTLPGDRRIEDIPFQPWAKVLFEYRRASDDRDSPHARCKPDVGPRQIGTAYGFEIVEFLDLQRVIIFDIGGPHSFRTIYMDGRTHPAHPDVFPSHYGHSIGWWDGDT